MRGGTSVRPDQARTRISAILATGKSKSARRVGTGLSDTQYLEALRDAVILRSSPQAAWCIIFSQLCLRKGALGHIVKSGVCAAGTVPISCYAKGTGLAPKLAFLGQAPSNQEAL